MGMLMLDTRKPIDGLNAAEPSFRLYACQNNVMYSRPQSLDGNNLMLSFCEPVLVMSFLVLLSDILIDP